MEVEPTSPAGIDAPEFRMASPPSQGSVYHEGNEQSDSDHAHTDSVMSPVTSESRQATSLGHNDNYFTTGSEAAVTPIAICGLGMRLPGGIQNADQFWDLLLNGRDARSPIPDRAFNSNGFDDSLQGRWGIKAKQGYFLADDLTRLDTSFFSMSRTEVERCDPQQRLLLEVARECLEDAGEVNYRGQAIGCYVGTFGDDWLQTNSKETQHSGGYIVTGSTDFFLANRISYEYDLRGPSMVIKTGCSASMVGLHEACRALHYGDADGAIVAGSNLITGPALSQAMTAEGVLSPEGSCKSFDASADGYARAEGISVIYVKRLQDALRDGNPIRAVIRSTGTNGDGKTQGIMVPSAEAHERLIRKVYADVGIDPADTPFVECHGTGTPTGDPIETSAVGKVFGGESGVYIGSVKPNIGHGEGSAGISSLIKSVLALEHKTIPPNIKFKVPNPNIPFVEKNLKVPTVPTPWPNGKAERISVNSFGVGGANAHAIIESFRYPDHQHAAAAPCSSESNPYLLLSSANTQPSLTRQKQLHQDYARDRIAAIPGIAYTLAVRREWLPHRAFQIVRGGKVIEASGTVKSPPGPSDRQVAMIFSGQGAQWAGMGKELLQNNTGFRQDVEAMDRILQNLKHPPSWTIMSELQKPAETSQINKAELAQPLCTALQIALYRQFERLDVVPATVIGHSSGEIAAAYAAGYISLEFAMAAAYYRGFVTRSGRRDGAMAAIGLGAEQTRPFLCEEVVVACENSPQSTTISGDRDRVEQVVSSIEQSQPGTFARVLKVDMAYHSHHMKSLEDEYLTLLQQEQFVNELPPQPRTKFISSVTTKAMEDSSSFGPEYWVANLVSPVRFSSAVTNLAAMSPESDTFLEIGPHSALAGPLRQICAAISRPCRYVSSQKRGSDCSVALLSSVGQLYQENARINLRPLFPLAEGRVVPGLPCYPWDHSGPSFWYESRIAKDWRGRKYPHHCLLGLRSIESPDNAPQWRNVLSLDEVPWLNDHRLRSNAVFPFAGYVAVAGEAVRQLAGASMDYSSYRLRHVVARAALVLNETSPVEMVTALRQHRMTDADDSPWFDFTVSTFNGSAWVKNCEGQVVHVSDEPRKVKPAWGTELLPRAISTPAFYNGMRHVGYGWGPEFQALSDITSSTTLQLAEAKLVDRHRLHNSTSPFTVHPTALDSCLQLSAFVTARGLIRNLDCLYVPTSIDEIQVFGSAAEMRARSWIGDGEKLGSVECVADGDLVIRMSGLGLTALDMDGIEAADGQLHAAARLQWLPAFDYLDPKTLLHPPTSHREQTKALQELTLLCMLEQSDAVAGLTPCQPHFAKLRDWLGMQIELAQQGRFPLVPDSARLATLTTTDRRLLLDSHLAALSNGPKRAFAIGAKRLCDRAAHVFTGIQDTMEILKEDDMLFEIYNAESFEYGDFVRLLSHSRPDLRVLEVGAGTGGTTEPILRDLGAEGGFPLYAQYTFTDISAGFFVEAKERFAFAPNMEYKVLDITQSPFDQGFESQEHTYDLILAANVLHATPCLRESLEHLKLLLKPDGILLLTELSPNLPLSNYVFGHFSGWWLGEKDGRVFEPQITVERWDSELKAAGFSGVDHVVYDEEPAYNNTFAITSRPRNDKQQQQVEKRVTLLCDDITSDVTGGLISSMQQLGWQVTLCPLATTPPEHQDIISCLDLEGSFFNDLTEQSFGDFRKSMNSIAVNRQRLLWLTHPVQLKCNDPRSAQLIGAARSLRSELALQLFTLELEKTESRFHEIVTRVFENINRQGDDDGKLAQDTEFAVHNGDVCVGRYHPFSLTDELGRTGRAQSQSLAKETNKILHVEKPGSLETLYWRDEPLVAEIPDDHVEIETRAVGLNYRDVLLCIGLIPAQSPVSIGLEASGIVRRVGTAVRWLAPGDRVMCQTFPCLATNVAVPAQTVTRIPNDLSFKDAATMPLCYATVIRSIIDLGRLRKGQSILIHSACGGIGLAAIQVCKMLGVDMYLTVGSERKVEFLVKNLGISRSRIFNSRDASFAEHVRRETSGRGVDMVLNSLSGELLHESWKCVAKFGALAELGQRDIRASGRLNMLPFLDNRLYYGVDTAQLGAEQPAVMQDILTRLVGFYEQGHLGPILHVTTFDARDAAQALRHVQDGNHIGKVVLIMPDPAAEMAPTLIPSCPPVRHVKFDPDATYILAGGTGGLGRSIATWAVERGARNLTFVSRSAGVSKASRALFSELESMGCNVVAVPGRVDQLDDVQKAVDMSPKPVKGVFQLAMVLKDTQMMNMDWSQWADVLAPKVDGTWNLHQALLSQSLDFFWMASSITAHVDRPGQGNYNAANTFIDAFCQYRHSLGRPASVLNICAISDIGFVAENAQAERQIKKSGLYFLREREFLDFLELSLLECQPEDTAELDGAPRAVPPAPWTNRSQVVMGLRSKQHLSDPKTTASWARNRRMGLYHNVPVEGAASSSSAATAESNALKELLARAVEGGDSGEAVLKDRRTVEFIAHEIGRKIYDLMLRPDEQVEVGLTFAQMGMDSLMAIEMRRWFKVAFGLNVSVLEIMGTGSLTMSAELTVAKLLDKLQAV